MNQARTRTPDTGAPSSILINEKGVAGMHKHLSKPSIESFQRPILVDETEAARLLGICPRSLWTLRNEGKIPFVKIHTSIRYRVVDLEAFAASRATLQMVGE